MLQKIIKVGGSFGIIIPENFMVVNKLRKGDYLQIDEEMIKIIRERAAKVKPK